MRLQPNLAAALGGDDWRARHQALARFAWIRRPAKIALGDHHADPRGGGRSWMPDTLALVIAGDRFPHLAWRLDHGALDGIAPDQIFVSAGELDAQEIPPAQAIAGVIALLNDIRRRHPQARIIWRPWPSDAVGKAIARAASAAVESAGVEAATRWPVVDRIAH